MLMIDLHCAACVYDDTNVKEALNKVLQKQLVP
jgi:hypothetical protein